MLNRLLCCIAATSLIALSAAQTHVPEVGPRGLELDAVKVRRELKLTTSQETAITGILEKAITRHDGWISFGPEISLEQLDKDLQSQLTDTQRKRLEEVWIQRQGALALFDDSIAKTLGITPQQTEQLALINQDMELSATRGRPGIDVKEYSKVMAPIRARGYKKMLALLTSEQRAKWNAMQGAPLK